MAKRKPGPVALVEDLVNGDWVASEKASEELQRLLATDADFTAASAHALPLLTECMGPNLRTLLAVVNRAPPADWAARVDAWFVQAEKAKTLRDRRTALYLLTQIGGGDRWADPLPNLHARDHWPRLWKLPEPKTPDVLGGVVDHVTWGLRACPDRAFAEQFAIRKKLSQVATDWAWMGDDTRDLMNRMLAAKVAARKPSLFTVVYELQHNHPATALELSERLTPREQVEIAQELALYGKRMRPVESLVEWIGMLLRSPHAGVRFKAAAGACERVEQFGQDIGPIVPALAGLMDGSKLTGESAWALWWAVAALAVAAHRLPPHRAAVVREFEARLTGAAIPRQAAGHGLALLHMLDRDLKAVRALFDHADAKVCVGAIMGVYESVKHLDLPNHMHDFRRLAKPLMSRLNALSRDPRKPVAASAKKVLGWM